MRIWIPAYKFTDLLTLLLLRYTMVQLPEQCSTRFGSVHIFYSCVCRPSRPMCKRDMFEANEQQRNATRHDDKAAAAQSCSISSNSILRLQKGHVWLRSSHS